MPKPEEVKVLNIDDVTYAVDSLSEEVQTLVAVFNEWNAEEVELSNKLYQVHLAKEALSQQIVSKVREGEEEKNAPVADEPTSAPTPSEPPPPLTDDGEIGFADQ
jgi:chromosome segregation ATPase